MQLLSCFHALRLLCFGSCSWSYHCGRTARVLFAVDCCMDWLAGADTREKICFRHVTFIAKWRNAVEKETFALILTGSLSVCCWNEHCSEVPAVKRKKTLKNTNKKLRNYMGLGKKSHFWFLLTEWTNNNFIPCSVCFLAKINVIWRQLQQQAECHLHFNMETMEQKFSNLIPFLVIVTTHTSH